MDVKKIQNEYNEKKDLITELVFEIGVTKMILEYEGIELEIDILKKYENNEIGLIRDYFMNRNRIIDFDFICKYELENKIDSDDIKDMCKTNEDLLELNMLNVYQYFEIDYKEYMNNKKNNGHSILCNYNEHHNLCENYGINPDESFGRNLFSYQYHYCNYEDCRYNSVCSCENIYENVENNDIIFFIDNYFELLLE